MDNTTQFVGRFDIVGLPTNTDIEIPINVRAGEPPVLIDYTGYRAKLHVRREGTKPPTQPLLELSTDDGTILVSGTSPNITLKFTKLKTSTLKPYDNLVYDLILISPTNVISRILYGSFSIFSGITE